MIKPKNWENTSAYGDFEPLELGGHVCRIIKVEETKSKTGKDMIVVYVDIAEGEQTGYFRKQFDENTTPDRKWPNGGTYYQLLEDADGNTNRGFKTIIESVKKSNGDFNEDAIWNENFCEFFKGKYVGCVFGREQYLNRENKPKFATKIFNFRDVETIHKGVDVPEDKLLEPAQAPKGFTNANSFADEDVPF